MLRARLRIGGLLQSTADVLAMPGVAERVLELGGGWRDDPTYGANREEFLRALAG